MDNYSDSSTAGGTVSASLQSNWRFDRKHAKRAVKNLDFFALSLSTQEHLQRARNVWDTFTQVMNMSFTDEKPPLRDDIIKFADVLITHTQARADPVPCLQTIQTTLAQLLRYLTWKYQSFQWGDYEAAGITSFLNGACLSNRLLRGVQSEQIWVGARLARLMSTAWIESHLTDGSPSWDVTVRKLLSFVLISSTAARPGDLSPRQRYWPGLALRYRDILIYFDEHIVEGQSSLSLENLSMVVQLRYTKGAKHNAARPKPRFFRAATDPRNFPYCPVLILITHCLRHGLLYGRSVEEVLQDAVLHGKRLRWKFPDRPVLCPLKIPFDLDTVPDRNIFADSVKGIAQTSGIASTVTAKHLRVGAARDVAHLPSQSTVGTAPKAVAAQLGHGNTSFNRGVTDDYVGHPEAYFFNDRVEADRFDVLGPRATLTPQTRQGQHVKPRSPDEITTYCEKQGWNSTNIRARSRASDHLKRQDVQAANDSPSVTGARTEELNARSLATINSAVQAFFTSQSSEERPVPLGFSEEANSTTTPSPPEEANSATAPSSLEEADDPHRHGIRGIPRICLGRRS